MLDAKLSISNEGHEKRRHQRVDVDVQVKYKVINRKVMHEIVDPKSLLDDGHSVNISLSGLSLTTGTPLTKGDFVKLELILPETGRMTRALAEVMWSGPDGVSGHFLSGIRFLIILNEADEHSVKRFVQSNTKG